MGNMTGRSAEAKTRKKSQEQERLVARVSREDKAVIAHAAAVMGQSVGSFIVAEVRTSALQAIESRERILLKAAESRRFVEAEFSTLHPTAYQTFVEWTGALQSRSRIAFSTADIPIGETITFPIEFVK
jgi:uncharacterized protein (DUF1778 family)